MILSQTNKLSLKMPIVSMVNEYNKQQQQQQQQQYISDILHFYSSTY